MTFDDLMRERDNVLANATVDVLLTSLLLILAEWTDEDMPNEVRLIHAWTIEELEKRVPAIVPIIARQLESGETERYGQLVVIAVENVLGI
jgi:hypothetical protein